MKIIEVKRMGIPAKQFFKINEQQVVKFLNNKSRTKPTTINKIKEIRINNKLFNKPSVEDVKIYCTERENNIDAENFINFYESKGWMVGSNKMKDWKACVRTWEMREKKTNYKSNSKGMSKLDAQINEWQKAKKLL